MAHALRKSITVVTIHEATATGNPKNKKHGGGRVKEKRIHIPHLLLASTMQKFKVENVLLVVIVASNLLTMSSIVVAMASMCGLSVFHRRTFKLTKPHKTQKRVGPTGINLKTSYCIKMLVFNRVAGAINCLVLSSSQLSARVAPVWGMRPTFAR